MFTKVESNLITQEWHDNMCLPHILSTVCQAQNPHQPLRSWGRQADKYISQNTVAFANYFSIFVISDSCVTAAFLIHSHPPFFLPSFLPSLSPLPFLLLSFYLFIKSKEADLLPFNFTSLGKHCMNVIPYGECCQHFCWYQSWIYSRDSFFMSLVKKKNIMTFSLAFKRF